MFMEVEIMPRYRGWTKQEPIKVNTQKVRMTPNPILIEAGKQVWEWLIDLEVARAKTPLLKGESVEYRFHEHSRALALGKSFIQALAV